MSKPEYQIIQEERERAERNMTGDLASMGVSVSKQHFTGDSSYPTEYTIKHGATLAIGPTFDMALMAFVQELIKSIKDATKRSLREAQQSTEHKLVPSDNHGRFALDHHDGSDITCGQPMEILICGQWIAGRVEHGFIYVTERGPAAGYFLSSQDKDATWIGLTDGMRVRLL